MVRQVQRVRYVCRLISHIVWCNDLKIASLIKTPSESNRVWIVGTPKEQWFGRESEAVVAVLFVANKSV